jgi:hypothetical protein
MRVGSDFHRPSLHSKLNQKLKAMSNIPLIQRFVEEQLAQSATLMASTWSAMQTRLQAPRDKLIADSERQHYFGLMQALTENKSLYTQRFTESLQTSVLKTMSHIEDDDKAGTPSKPIEPISTLKFQLMDETQLETDIEVSRATQLIDSAAEWELRELQSLTSALRGQDHVSADSNPLRAQVYAKSLWKAACALPITPIQQKIILRISAPIMANLLKVAWATACKQLTAQGVTPSNYRTVVLAPIAGNAPDEVDVTQPGALDALRRVMPQSKDLPARSGPSHMATSSGSFETDLERALLLFEQKLNRMSVTTQGPAGGPSGSGGLSLSTHHHSFVSATGVTSDRQTIELITRLFDAIFADDALHASIRHLMTRLQAPALRIALKDPAMLEDHSHPVWLFMARLANASNCYPHTHDPRFVTLLETSTQLVEKLVTQPHQDAALFKQNLALLDSFLAKQLQAQQIQAQGIIEALELAEQAETLQKHFSTRLLEQMAPLTAISLPIRRFISGPWSQLLAHARIHFGEKDPQTTGYLTAVDELLWTLQVPDHPSSRQRMIKLLPGLLQRLRTGMALIDMPAPEQEAVFDELMQSHAKALRPGSAEKPKVADATDSPQEIMRMLREEVAEPPDASAHFQHSVIDLSSLEPAPKDSTPAVIPAETDNAHDWFTRIRPGQRYQMFLKGRWRHMQLLWRSQGQRFFLFASETPSRTQSITRLAMERLHESNWVKPEDSHALIQRAANKLLVQKH